MGPTCKREADARASLAERERAAGPLARDNHSADALEPQSRERKRRGVQHREIGKENGRNREQREKEQHREKGRENDINREKEEEQHREKGRAHERNREKREKMAGTSRYEKTAHLSQSCRAAGSQD